MKHTIKPALLVPRHSALLDVLTTHADNVVQVAAAQFVDSFQPPADAPRCLIAMGRLERGLRSLRRIHPEVRPLADHVLSGLNQAIRATRRHLELTVPYATPGTDRAPAATDRWIKQFPAYAALLLVLDDDLTSLRALAAEYLRAVFTGQRIPAQVANRLRLSTRSDLASQIKRDSAPWQDRFQTTLQLLQGLGVADQVCTRQNFQRAACMAYLWAAKLPGLHQRRAFVHHRTLTPDALKLALEDLAADLVQARPLSTAIATGFLSGLPWNLAQFIPLSCPEGSDWVIWLDLQAGCWHINLNPVVRGAAQNKGDERYLKATRTFERALPAMLLRALRCCAAKAAGAFDLGELCGTHDVPPHTPVGEGDGRVLKPSIARLYNSRAVMARLMGVSAPMTALVLGAFARVPQSKFFYYGTTTHDLDQALKCLERALNWGAICDTHRDDQPASIGPNVVPEMQTIADIARTLASRVLQSVPPRRYTADQLLRHHRAFVDYTVFLISLVVLGRNRRTLRVLGIWQSSTLGVGALADKRRKDQTDADVVAVCRQAQRQAVHFRRHCKALRRRLIDLGFESAEALDYLQRVVDGTAEPAFCTIDERGRVRPHGTAQVYRDLPAELVIKADSARHFWDTVFGRAGVQDDLIDAQARRVVQWARRWGNINSLRIEDLRDQIDVVQEQVLALLEIAAIEGLRK